MSLDIFVLAKASSFPSAQKWADAIRREGFDIKLDRGFDTRVSSGFRPCPTSDRGFEYSFGPLSGSDIEAFDISSEVVKTFDSIAGLHYKTEADLEISRAASAVLAKLSDGLVIEGESGAVMNPDQALGWARGEFEPASTSAKVPRQGLSHVTIAKLSLSVLFVCYLLFKWIKG